MIRAIIAYDDFDENLGNYFEKSYNYINDVLSTLDFDIHSLDGSRCTEADMTELLPTINYEPFIFSAFCHGDDDGSCLVTGEDFVSHQNSTLFVNSLFYSTACHIGRNLSHILIANGTQAFIGYTQKSYAPQDENLEKIFVECELYALREFLTTGKTIEQAYKEMLLFMDENIKKLYDAEEYFDAGWLQKNRDYILCLPETSGLRNTDFII